MLQCFNRIKYVTICARKLNKDKRGIYEVQRLKGTDLHSDSDKRIPAITARRVLRLRVQEKASRHGGQLRIYCSCGQRTRGGPPAWGLD